MVKGEDIGGRRDDKVTEIGEWDGKKRKRVMRSVRERERFPLRSGRRKGGKGREESFL